MRKIKFRAFNEVSKFMLDWTDFKGYEIEQMLIVGTDYRIFNDDEFISLEYSGLEDSKGVEIYEGDVVKIESDDPYYVTVHFINGSFMFWDSLSESGVFPFLVEEEYVVVGNVYQHPHLLEVQNDR